MSSDDDSNDNLPLVAQLLAAEERNKAAIFRKALDARPKATKKAFDKKQVEFIDGQGQKVIHHQILLLKKRLPCFWKNLFYIDKIVTAKMVAKLLASPQLTNILLP